MLRKDRLGLELMLFLVVLIWAANQTIGKLAMREMSPAVYTSLRFLLAAPLMLLVLKWREGGWGFELPKLPANPLVMGIRAGKQGANTRLVFDLAKALDNCRIVKINPETLEVRIR